MGGKKDISLDVDAEWLDSVDPVEQGSEKEPQGSDSVPLFEPSLENLLNHLKQLTSVEKKAFVVKADDNLSELVTWALDILDNTESKMLALGATDEELRFYTGILSHNEKNLKHLRNFATSGVLIERHVSGDKQLSPLNQLEEDLAKVNDIIGMVHAICTFEFKWGGEPYVG